MKPPRRLGPHEVHLWQARADMPPACALAWLQPAELQQAQRFVFERDRDRHLATRCLVRQVLSRHAEVDPADWRFAPNRWGRPEVVAPQLPQPLHFNVSHSAEAVLMVVARCAEIGVDVESHRADDEAAIAQQVFSPAERAWLAGEPDRFLMLWTLKEAYVKACGQGLSMPLQRFSVLPDEAGGARLLAPLDIEAEPTAWRFWCGLLRPGLPWAVAVRNPLAVLSGPSAAAA